MPRVSRLKLPPIDWGKETLGQRVARIRKERGYTQVELAEKIGILQTLVTDYENDRLRLTAEMALRWAPGAGCHRGRAPAAPERQDGATAAQPQGAAKAGEH